MYIYIYREREKHVSNHCLTNAVLDGLEPGGRPAGPAFIHIYIYIYSLIYIYI